MAALPFGPLPHKNYYCRTAHYSMSGSDYFSGYMAHGQINVNDDIEITNNNIYYWGGQKLYLSALSGIKFKTIEDR